MAAGERTRIDSIAEVEAIAAIGPRGPGTDAERRAARHLAARAESLGRSVRTESFFTWPRWPGGLALLLALGAGAGVLSVSAPEAGVALALVTLVAYLLDAGAALPLARRLLGRRASQNVISPAPARAARRARAGGAHGLGAHGLRLQAGHPPAPPPPPAGARMGAGRRARLLRGAPGGRGRDGAHRCPVRSHGRAARGAGARGGHLALPRRDRRRRQRIRGRSRPSRRGTAGRHARALRSPSAAHRSAGERGRRRDARVPAPSPARAAARPDRVPEPGRGRRGHAVLRGARGTGPGRARARAAHQAVRGGGRAAGGGPSRAATASPRATPATPRSP